MNKALIILFLISMLSGCKNDDNNGNIRIAFEGIKSDTVYIAAWPPLDDSKEKIDTIILENGKLNYNLQIDELNKVAVVLRSASMVGNKMITSSANIINFWMDQNDTINVQAKIDRNYIDYEVTGNPFSQQHSEARQAILPILKESHQLRIKRQVSEEMSDSLQASLLDAGRQLWQQNLDRSLEFVEMHPDYEYSAWILFNVVNTNDKQKVIDLNKTLSEDVRKSYWGVKLENMVYGFGVTKPGASFPNIVDESVNGNPINLKDYRGKYLLIDFWGSWCGPCIQEISELKKYQELYNSDFNILGIACNDRLDNLKSLIQSEGIKWENILSSSENQSRNYVDKFQIHEYPTKVLLDTNGLVIQTYIGVDPLLYKKLEEILPIQ